MNKYKDKTLYRLIPIKPTVYIYIYFFFFWRIGSSFFLSLCCVVLTLRIKNISSVCRFCHSVLYTTIYSKLVLHFNLFIFSAEHKCYFKKVGNQKVAGPEWLAYYYYLINTGLGQREWVNNDRNYILGWTIPLMTVSCIVLSLEDLRASNTQARIRLSRLFTLIIDITNWV